MRIIHGPGGCLGGGRHLQSLAEKRQDKIQRDRFFLFVAKTVFLKTGNIRWVASSSFAKNSFPENKQLPILEGRVFQFCLKPKRH